MKDPKDCSPPVTIRPAGHQPSKAEMEEDVSLPIDPEALGRMVVKDRHILIREDDRET